MLLSDLFISHFQAFYDFKIVILTPEVDVGVRRVTKKYLVLK